MGKKNTKSQNWLDDILNPLEEKAHEILSCQDRYLIFYDPPKEPKKVGKEEKKFKPPIVYHANHIYQAARALLEASAKLREMKDRISREAAYSLIDIMGNAYEMRGLKIYHDLWVRKKAGYASGKKGDKIDWFPILEIAKEKDLSASKSNRARWIQKDLRELKNKYPDIQIPSISTLRKKI